MAAGGRYSRDAITLARVQMMTPAARRVLCRSATSGSASHFVSINACRAEKASAAAENFGDASDTGRHRARGASDFEQPTPSPRRSAARSIEDNGAGPAQAITLASAVGHTLDLKCEEADDRRVEEIARQLEEIEQGHVSADWANNREHDDRRTEANVGDLPPSNIREHLDEFIRSFVRVAPIDPSALKLCTTERIIQPC